MDSQVWIEFFKDNWLVIVVGLIVLLLVVNLVKTVIKWVFVLAIVASLIIYSGYTINDINDTIATVKDDGVNKLKDEALKVMKDEATEAKFTQNKDGSFLIETPNLKVTGAANEDKVKVSLRGLSLGEWSRSEAMNSFIQDAKKNK